MHDRDVAGEEVRELGEEQRRPEVAHQALVEEDAGIGGLPDLRQDLTVDRVVALAAAGGDDQVHAALQRRVGLGAGGVEGEPGGVAAEPLPGLHLPLIGFLRDLLVVIERDDRVDRVGREGGRVEARRGAAREGGEMRIDALAGGGDEADPRDDDLAHQAASANSPIWRARSRMGASSPSGNGMVLKRRAASQMSLPPTAIFALVTA